MTETDRESAERLARNLWATHQESAALMSHEKVYRMAFRHGFVSAQDRHHGTPCAEIRWQQERDTLFARVEAAEARAKAAEEWEKVLRDVVEKVVAADNLREDYHRLPNDKNRIGERKSRKGRAKDIWLRAFRRAAVSARAALTEKGQDDA